MLDATRARRRLRLSIPSRAPVVVYTSAPSDSGVVRLGQTGYGERRRAGKGDGLIVTGLAFVVLGGTVFGLALYARHLHKRLLRFERRGGVALGIVDELVKQTEGKKEPRKRRRLTALALVPAAWVLGKAKDHPAAAAVIGTGTAGLLTAGLLVLPGDQDGRREAPAEATAPSGDHGEPPTSTVEDEAAPPVTTAPPPPSDSVPARGEAPTEPAPERPPPPPEPTAPPPTPEPAPERPPPQPAPEEPTEPPAPPPAEPPAPEQPPPSSESGLEASVDATVPLPGLPAETPSADVQVETSTPQCQLVYINLTLTEVCL